MQESRRAAKLVARDSGDLPLLDSAARMGSEDMLPNEEVVRRLRLLGQPATLFGEVCCSTSFSLVLLCPVVHQSHQTFLLTSVEVLADSVVS